MNRKSKNGFFSKIFIPHYDELSLFSMSYVLVLLILVHKPPWNWTLANFKFKFDNIFFLVLIFGFLSGMFLCLFHAFSNRQKTLIEKKVMVFFAAILNGFSGIWAGTYILYNPVAWGLSLFPLCNIISGFILLALLRGGGIDEGCIDDDNVSVKRVLSIIIIVTGIFSICHFYFNLVWAINFSICMTWSTNINHVSDSLPLRGSLKRFQL